MAQKSFSTFVIMYKDTIQLVECPRDAMQGWKTNIPTAKKIAYLNTLLKIGFHTLDCGSFVSPKAIPQMADTAEVIAQLDIENTSTKILTIIANSRGAMQAMDFEQINYLGFPFSISPTFQKRNANQTIEEALEQVITIQKLCVQRGKILVVYISMAFGNPYEDVYNEALVLTWVQKIASLGITTISLSDTVGLATARQIKSLLTILIPAYPNIQFGVHLHASSTGWKEKLDAAYTAGCTRFDGAIKGIGGCPMADDILIGNMNTEWIIEYMQQQNIPLHIHKKYLQQAIEEADKLFI